MSAYIIGLNITVLVASGIIITKAIKIFVSSSTRLAHLLNLSEYTISFLLISFATSLPELVVAVTSGLEKNSILSYGDAIGSNLVLLTLVLAIPILLDKPISTTEILKDKDIYYSTFFLTLAMALAIDGRLSRLDGAILIAGYIFYSRAVLKRASFFETIKDRLEHTNTWKQGVLFGVSLLLLLVASEGIVRSALNLSSGLDVNLGYIGLTMTAVGTSLPEIAFSLGIIKANGNRDEIVGDIIGSVVSNSTIVLGTAALIYPINLKGTNLGFPTMLLLFSTMLLFLAFAKTKETLSKKEAVTLLSVYIIFLAVEYLLVI